MTGRTLVALALVASAPARAADCVATEDEVLAEARAIFVAAAAMDAAALSAAHARLVDRLGCLQAPVTPATAARVHAAQAVERYLVADEASTSAALRAACRAAPDQRLPATIAPPGNRLHELQGQACAAPAGASIPLAPAPSLWVDGRPWADVPSDQHLLVQLVPDDHVQSRASYVAEGSLVPAWAQAPAPPPLPRTAPLEAPSASERQRDPRLARASAVAGALALGSGVAALGLASAWDTQATEREAGTPGGWTDEQARSRGQLANGLWYGAQAGLGVSVGLGVAWLAWAR